ncbi:hypothetical protein BD769DRAFT_1643057 [Suillus cothurnatus]|nr:hypothetical protein BD769DRAFT_1643057 [Suillus cothurnatus]
MGIDACHYSGGRYRVLIIWHLWYSAPYHEIIAVSGDITALDWVGKSSEFNSCLPADITSYDTPSHTLPSISEDEMQRLVSSLQDTVVVELALKLYSSLERLSAPRFAHRRLHLPCIAFPVTEIRRRSIGHTETYFTYEVKADGLHDLKITTEDRLLQFSQGRPARQSFLLVRPWDRRLLELPDYAEDTESVDDFTLPGSLGEQGPVDSELTEHVMRLIVRLRQPFSAFLLVQQRSGEYKRIASDRDIIMQVKDVDSVDGMMDIRTLEILNRNDGTRDGNRRDRDSDLNRRDQDRDVDERREGSGPIPTAIDAETYYCACEHVFAQVGEFDMRENERAVVLACDRVGDKIMDV